LDTPPDNLARLREEALIRGIQPSYYDVHGEEQFAPADVLQRLIEAIGDPVPPPAESTAIPVMWQPPQTRRIAGLAISLYGLVSRTNWGVGDFGDLIKLTSWAAKALGAEFIALNPLHATHNREPYNISPYLPLTAYFRNYLYLDITALDEFSHPAMRDAFGDPLFQAELERLRAAEYVDYEAAARIKSRFLRLAFSNRSPDSEDAFIRFIGEGGELLSLFSLFLSLDEHFRETRPGTWLWTEWPAEYHDPRAEACQRFAREHVRDLRFHQWVQLQIEKQLARAQQHALACGMSVGLFHDLALSTDRYGFDRWASPDYYVDGCRVGAPPDAFSPEGQDWSFPPVRATRARQDSYSLFAASVRRNALPGGALRMDHVMRLFRLFWIPEGYSPRDGAYVQEPWRDLLQVLSRESHQHRFQVVGEDLGTVTDEMRSALTDARLLGYRVLFFERDQQGYYAPEHYPDLAVATVSTHDLPTLAGFWAGKDIDARRDAGLVGDAMWQAQWDDRRRDKQSLLDALHAFGLLPDSFPRLAADVPPVSFEVRRAALTLLARTPCQWLVINQEDLTGETLQQNLPGSTSQYPNWKRKMRVSVEDLAQLDVLWLRDILADSGRIG
jgi:4-alpha-glucanotransferase